MDDRAVRCTGGRVRAPLGLEVLDGESGVQEVRLPLVFWPVRHRVYQLVVDEVGVLISGKAGPPGLLDQGDVGV